MTTREHVGAVALAILAGVAACASNPPKAPPAAPAFSSFPTPVIPGSITVTAEVRSSHDRAWQTLQAGDVRGAIRAFTAILARCPECYPSETGLAFAHLAAREFDPASGRFRGALARDARYLPAWEGLVESELALDRQSAAIDALEHVVQLDPQRESARTRLVVLQLRETQGLIDGARRAREEKRPDDARALLDRALTRAPSSAPILGEIASLEAERGRLDEGELYARRALQLDPANAEARAALALVTDAREAARHARLPAEFRAIGDAPSVTRGEAAAFIGIRLERLVAAAPRVPVVVTDVRQHWAESWILTVTAAGVMEVQPNYTFQPSQPVRRDELAAVLSRLVELASASRPSDLDRWKASRPVFNDVPPAHLFYPHMALSVACGALSASEDGRFQPARPVTGAEFVRAITRVQAIAGR